MAQMTVTADVLNVRRGPSGEHGVITRIPRGTVVDAGAASDGWREVRFTLRDAAVTGWAAERYLAPAAAAPADPRRAPIAGRRRAQPPTPADATATRSVAPPWFAVATGEIGVREYPGPADNPRVVEYHGTTSLRASDDEVPWCSAFANWCLRQASLRGSGSAAARSWLQWGVPLDRPRPGCVVVLRRGTDPVQGHVGFFVRSRGATFDLLGGNQGNQVCIAPYATSRVIGYRWPGA
jgi:uncharacterized protein (TIGR02594 family)